jgi:hypothetical protein
VQVAENEIERKFRELIAAKLRCPTHGFDVPGINRSEGIPRRAGGRCGHTARIGRAPTPPGEQERFPIERCGALTRECRARVSDNATWSFHRLAQNGQEADGGEAGCD